MESHSRQELEAEVKRCCEANDYEGAATRTIRGYGAEIFSFLSTHHRDRDELDDVFAVFAEVIWKQLPTFRWASSLRTFAYGIARRVSLRQRRNAYHRRNREVPDDSIVTRVAAEVRSNTAPILRSDVKNRVAELRASLPEEDQELLVLRVDRKLSWLELADVLQGEDAAPLEGDARAREAARLRKRFQLVKDKIRVMAEREGLLGERDEDG
jgi:RNA polymerase sigma-70 factor (ECF subfamily)